MKNNGLFDLFVEELKDMYSCENQIVESLPKLIKHVSLPELKEVLNHHLEETLNQVAKLEKIFLMLGMEPSEETCEAMKGIIKEANHLLANKNKSSTMDAAIIAACQKIEHYEIASYGTLKSFAKHLDMDSEIVDLIDDALDEEGAADKKLTKIADGSFFSSGVNQEAAEAHAGKYRK